MRSSSFGFIRSCKYKIKEDALESYDKKVPIELRDRPARAPLRQKIVRQAQFHLQHLANAESHRYALVHQGRWTAIITIQQRAATTLQIQAISVIGSEQKSFLSNVQSLQG